MGFLGQADSHKLKLERPYNNVDNVETTEHLASIEEF